MDFRPRPNPLNEHDYYNVSWENFGDNSDLFTAESREESSNDKDGLQVDNSSTILSKISRLYSEKSLCDVCLVVGGKEFPSHRLILCASSEVFQVMLMDPNWTESHNSRITLQEPMQCCQVFDDFLAYLYTGRIQIHHSTVMPIMALADKYNVHDLMGLCKNFMIEHIPTASQCNQLMNWLQYSLACGHQNLANACRDYVRWNFQSIAQSEEFGTCEVDVLISLLESDELVIYDEMTLFHCMTRWMEAQEEQNENLVIQVFSFIRFPMMSPRQLADLLQCSLTLRYKEFFVERMAVAMAFHSGGSMEDLQRWNTNQTIDSHLFTPRLYTAEKWSTHLTLENFTSLPAYHTQTLLLSSPVSCADFESDTCNEWVIEFSPKGVWFRSCCLIVWQGNVEVPERVLRTVRLSLTLKEPEEAHVRVAVLVYGTLNGVEHVRHVVVRNFIFSAEDRVLRYDNLLPFSELNPSSDSVSSTKSPFLIGPQRDTLKVQVIILPRQPRRKTQPRQIRSCSS